MKNEPRSRNKKKRDESLMISSNTLTIKGESKGDTRGLVPLSRTSSKVTMMTNDDNIEANKSPDPQQVIKPVDLVILQHIERAVNQLNNEQVSLCQFLTL